MRLWLPIAAALVVVACSGEDAATDEEGGGKRPVGAGGSSGKAGAAGAGTGGVTNAGAAGDTTTGQGGAMVVGGAAGTTSFGGATTAGGTGGNGGSGATGGTTATGGASSLGGASAAGTGGKGGTGGTGGTGGAAGSSGTSGTAGASAAPVLVVSTTLDGPSTLTFPNSRAFHLRISGLTATNAAACVEIIGSTDGICASPPTNWAQLPNADWSYDAGSKLWRAAIPKWAYAPGSYRSFVRNTDTGAQATPTVLQLTGPKLVFSLTPDGPQADQFPWSATVYGRIGGLTATDTKACIEVGPGKPECDVPGVGYTSLPNADWTYDANAQLWRSALAAKSYPPNTYVSHAYDTDDEAWSGGVPFTLLAPVCSWGAAIFGGDNPMKPATACTVANIGATEAAGGYIWTCGCQ